LSDNDCNRRANVFWKEVSTLCKYAASLVTGWVEVEVEVEVEVVLRGDTERISTEREGICKPAVIVSTNTVEKLGEAVNCVNEIFSNS
jgi:carbonic anhydrase/acetyltransferase-like protein (isoleucine patch superfamily)